MGVIKRGIDFVLPEWTVEEAEIASGDQRIWSHFLCQAVNVDICMMVLGIGR